MSGNSVDKLRTAFIAADAVVIGAGAGLSTSAGYAYSGARFDEHFADFGAKYGFSDMYSGGFYPYDTPEEFWAYWSRYIYINRYVAPPRPVYEELLSLVKAKDYFVITTNVDHCFQRAGFDKARLYYTQGDFGLLQCSGPCHDATYDNEQLIRRMVAEQKDMRVPTELVPHCKKCGRPMTTNLRADDRFVEDDGWRAAAARYDGFLSAHKNARVLFLELGVGYNTPGVIKYPFMRMTMNDKNATYACINKGEVYIPDAIADRAIGIDGDIGDVITQLLKGI